MFVYRCEDSLESVFTAIYQVYENHHQREEVFLSLDDDPRLFSTVIEVETDAERYQKVIRTLKDQFGESDYERLCLALASLDAEKAQAVFGTVAAGLDSGCGAGHLFDNLTDTWVYRAFGLARSVCRENDHYREFIRFEELESGILYSPIKPENNILPFLMPHFADRLPGENFVIHDVGRELFGVHPAGEEWLLVQGSPTAQGSPAAQGSPTAQGGPTAQEESVHGRAKSLSEEKYRMLFKTFCQNIEIKERRNSKLQKGMLPLRYREYMTEFQ